MLNMDSNFSTEKKGRKERGRKGVREGGRDGVKI
jgi:hypothetical protein